MASIECDAERAVDRLLALLAVPGITGEERAIGQAVMQALADAGVPRELMQLDQANEQIPHPTQTGNLIVTLPGTVPGPRLLFMAHLDTVPLCAGAIPERRGGKIVAQGPTALGGDDRTGVACLVTLACTLMEKRLPHPPLTLLFAVREESGLWGARYVNPKDLGSPAMCFNIDGSRPYDLTIGAVGAERWEVEIQGRAAHAGVHPEAGISASVVASLALAEVYRTGWFGKIKKKGREGTSNVGSIGNGRGGSAGEATNIVTNFVHVRGESRSHSLPFVRAITRTYRNAFKGAARKVRNDKGRSAKIKFKSALDYHPFKLSPTAPVVRYAQNAAYNAGLKPNLRVTNGGLDANWMVRHGIPTVTFGAGQREVHTIDEYVEIRDYLDGCRFALALATGTVNGTGASIE